MTLGHDVAFAPLLYPSDLHITSVMRASARASRVGRLEILLVVFTSAFSSCAWEIRFPSQEI